MTYRNIIVCLLMSFIMLACSDQMDMPGYGRIDSDGSVELTLEIPAAVCLTRSGEIDSEYRVNNVFVLIFKNDEDALLSQSLRIFSADSNNSGSCWLSQPDNNKVRLFFRLDNDLISRTDLKFYFIANLPENYAFAGNLRHSELKHASYGIIGSFETGLVMSGEASYSDVKEKNVQLVRNAAKVTVSSVNATTEEGNHDYGYAFGVFGFAGQSGMLGGVLDQKGDPTEVQEYPDDVDSVCEFLHPTLNGASPDGLGGKCFLVVKALFEGLSYYYRVDFYDKDKKTWISPTSNHWYQFVIKEVLSAGFLTPEEASAHPDLGLVYEIHDHCPQSFNMASDGIRELGVSHRIDYSGPATASEEWSNQEIFIRFYSILDGEIPKASDVRAMISVEDPSWLQLSDPEEVKDVELTGWEAFGDDSDDKVDLGKLFRCRLRFLPSSHIGSISTSVSVRWKGLEREIPVLWKRTFNGGDVVSTSLTMKYTGTETKITDDYWSFLSSTDGGTPVSGKEYLWGIQEKANNGKIRNQGFHFPVMYGDAESGYATYSYDVCFDKESKFKDRDYTCDWSVDGDQAVVDMIDIQFREKDDKIEKPLSFTVTRRNDPPDYAYATGVLNIKVKFDDSEVEEVYSFALYHTGFFHKDSQSYRMDEKDPKGYYYYEVVPFTLAGHQRYMLDRNLGAKSAEMYIRNSDGSVLMGNPLSAGGYYKVAYQEVNEEGNSYKDPQMYDDTSNRVSPPGYTIPSQRIWDYLRNSESFHTENVAGYFNAYYESSDSDIGRVYFPKSMFYYKGKISGEAQTGYYWTRTAATGTEKEEIGKWLKMLNLSGASTSYSNGCVVVSNKDLAYGASVRCVNVEDDDAVVKRTSFNVSGATHVYLYTQDQNGTRYPTTIWPGHAIGNYATMTDGHWFGFGYESTDVDPEDLYVIFNFVDSKGIIHTYSADAEGSAIYTSDRRPAECNGWKVVGDVNSKLKASAPYQTAGQLLLPAKEATALGIWWRCGRSDGSPFVYTYSGLADPSDYPLLKYRIYWPIEKGKSLSVFFDNLDNNVFDDSKIAVSNELYGYYSFDFSERAYWYMVSIGYDPAKSIVHDTLSKLFGNKEDVVNEGYLGNDTWLSERPADSRNYNVSQGLKRIYMYNDKKWNSVRIWYWSGTNDFGNLWPGPEMKKVEGMTEGLYWYFDIPEEADHILFNNGTLKTPDLTLSADIRQVYVN